MQHGNLSNESAHKIGIRFEAVIYNFGKLNKPGKALAETLMGKDLNLLLIGLIPSRKVQSWCYKWAVPYTQVVQADSTLEIPEICIEHHLLAYYDVDERLLAEIRYRSNPQIDAIKWKQ